MMTGRIVARCFIHRTWRRKSLMVSDVRFGMLIAVSVGQEG